MLCATLASVRGFSALSTRYTDTTRTEIRAARLHRARSAGADDRVCVSICAAFTAHTLLHASTVLIDDLRVRHYTPPHEKRYRGSVRARVRRISPRAIADV